VPEASAGFPLHIAINATHTVGRRTHLLRQRKLYGPDALAKLAVIDHITDEVLDAWPYVVYTDQIRQITRKVVKEICKPKE
jgi:hypothetical protein